MFVSALQPIACNINGRLRGGLAVTRAGAHPGFRLRLDPG
jgi:hypothetical protein